MSATPETFEITREFLDQGRSADGGYTKGQLEALGVPWPPPRGWRSSLVGTRVSAEAAEAFLELRYSQRNLFGGE